MDILGGGIEEKDTAVVIAASQVNAIPLEKVCDNFLSQAAQVAGDDEVIKVGGASGFLKMGVECGVGGGGHGGPHVVGVGNPLVHKFACGDMGNKGTGSFAGQNDRAGPCGGPLCSGRLLPTVLQGVAVLALRRAKMGGGQSRCVGSKAAVHQHGRQRHPFRHGGAGAV